MEKTQNPTEHNYVITEKPKRVVLARVEDSGEIENPKGIKPLINYLINTYQVDYDNILTVCISQFASTNLFALSKKNQVLFEKVLFTWLEKLDSIYRYYLEIKTVYAGFFERIEPDIEKCMEVEERLYFGLGEIEYDDLVQIERSFKALAKRCHKVNLSNE